MNCIFAATDHQGITHIIGAQGYTEFDIYYYNIDAEVILVHSYFAFTEASSFSPYTNGYIWQDCI